MDEPSWFQTRRPQKGEAQEGLSPASSHSRITARFMADTVECLAVALAVTWSGFVLPDAALANAAWPPLLYPAPVWSAVVAATFIVAGIATAAAFALRRIARTNRALRVPPSPDSHASRTRPKV
jgi:hypothetical protein